MSDDAALVRFRAYVERLHTRCHFREPGTNGPEDRGCNAYGQCGPNPLACPLGCAEKLRDLRTALIDARHISQARHAEGARDRHPGQPEACESAHDVVCKAVW
jgi:hypothetical protein